MSTSHTSLLGTPSEMRLDGRIAGVLFLLAGVSAPLLILLPGGTSDHWRWVLSMSVACVIWGTACLTLIRVNDDPRLATVTR